MISENERGLVLIIVLGLVLLLVTAAASFMLISTSEVRTVKSEAESMRAFYLAEAGLARTGYGLNQDADWSDGEINGIDCTGDGDDAPDLINFYALPYASTSLGGGSYSIELKNVDEDGEEGVDEDVIWVNSTGTYHGKARAIQAKLSRHYNVTSALEAEGSITILGSSAKIIGPCEEYANISFDNVFGMSKDKMRKMAKNYTYYNVTSSQEAFKDDTAEQVTWISSPDYLSQVTNANWTGSGILVVEGDFKMTGGTFDGIVWVIGELSVGAGGATINGGVFVESGVTVDTTLSGNASITYDEDAFSSLPAKIESWKEISP